MNNCCPIQIKKQTSGGKGRKTTSSTRKPANSKLHISKFLDPVSSVSTINPVFNEFSSAMAEQESMDAICWRTTFFLSADASSIQHFWIDPASVLGLSQSSIGSQPRDALQLIDHVRFRILPPFVVGTGSLNALSAFGALANVPMMMLAIDSSDTSSTTVERTELLGSTATKITTESDPSWITVLNFNLRKARSSGFQPLLCSLTSASQVWCLGSLAVVHLDTGAPVAGLEVPVEVTVSGRSSFMPSSSVSTTLADSGSWVPSTPANPTTHVAFTDVTSLKKMDD